MLQISLRLGQLCSYHLLGCFPWSLIFICKCPLASHRTPNGKEKNPTLPWLSSLQDLSQGDAYLGTQLRKDLKTDLLKVYLKTKGVQTHRSKRLLKSDSFLGLQAGQRISCALYDFHLRMGPQPGGHSEGANGVKVVFRVGQAVIQQFI